MSGTVPSSSKRKKSSSGQNHRKLPDTSPENGNTDDRKCSFKRVFSEEDVIHILNAFLEISKETLSPAVAAASLFDRVGKSLGGEINHTQVIEKLRKLRHKYSKRVLNQSSIRTPHERDVFEISHKIWGENSLQKDSNGSAKAPRSVVKKKKKKKKKKLKTLDDLKNVTKFDLEKDCSILMEEVSRFHNNLLMKEGLKCLDVSELKRLNEKWRLQQIREEKILAERAEMFQEEKKLILEALLTATKH